MTNTQKRRVNEKLVVQKEELNPKRNGCCPKGGIGYKKKRLVPKRKGCWQNGRVDGKKEGMVVKRKG